MWMPAPCVPASTEVLSGMAGTYPDQERPSYPLPRWPGRSTGTFVACARRLTRFRPLAKLKYHLHSLGDKKLKTKDFEITSF